MSASNEATGSLFPLADPVAIPAIGSPERNAQEEAALARGRELIHEQDGSIRDALFELEQEIRGTGMERDTRAVYDRAREYARALTSHVEQCWATAVLR